MDRTTQAYAPPYSVVRYRGHREWYRSAQPSLSRRGLDSWRRVL